MARVTKINVGGTNYDIAHEGELKNSGFEVVTALPTTGLFAGREVMYNGKKYIYSSGWKEEITANTMYEDKLLYNNGTIVPDGSIIDRLMMPSGMANVYAYTKPEAISVQYSQDAGVTWLDYELSEIDKQNLCTFSKSIYCGGPDVTIGNINYRLRVNLFPKLNTVWIFHKLILGFIYGSADNRWLTVRCLRKSQEDIDTNYVTIIDKGVISGSVGMMSVNLGNIDMLNSYDKVVLDMGYDGVGSGKGLALISLSMYASYSNPINSLAKYGRMYHYDIDKKSYFVGAVESKEIINFDINNIEPTQTGSSISKTSTWLWQYLVQAVNWLKANNVRLSAYNTKIAALEQADNDNNASVQSVRTDLTELSNGLATVATSGSYNDLTDTPTLFSGSYDDLKNTPTIPSSLADLSGSISEGQIGDGSIANSKLANPSMTLNGTTVNLGDTATLPCFISYSGTLFQARIENNWLQIYRNGIWANLYYLLSSLPTECRYITDLSDPSWYDESITEYELDNSATTQLLSANGSTNLANWLEAIDAQQITFNSSVIVSKGKGALDNIISNLKGKGYSVFVENDIDTILSSGNDWVMSIKIKRFNDTYKAIIECYVAR